MHQTFKTYYFLSEILKERVLGWNLDACYSLNKEELCLNFRSKKEIRQWRLKFIDGKLFHFINQEPLLPGKTSINQFKDLVGKQLLSVQWIRPDRIILLEFEIGILMVKRFGRLANMLYYAKGEELPEQIFRLSIKTDWEYANNEWKEKRIIFSDEGLASKELLDKHFAALKGLKAYDELPNDFFQLVGNKQREIIDQLIDHELGKDIETTWNQIELDSKNYLYQYYFELKQKQWLQQTQKSLQHFRKVRIQKEKELKEMNERRSYKELGDLVMANAHAISTGLNSAFLNDFIRGGSVRVKLDPQLNAAKNAEKYYRKAKNEIIERKNVEDKIAEFKEKEAKLSSILEKVQQANTMKDLRMKDPIPQKKEQSLDIKPYKLFHIDGFEVWVGKNAKSNDEVLRMAHKNDLWMHARGVTGSHVIIKRTSKTFPMPLIEKVASLAAWHSKGKSQGLVAVDYTFRKFVSKIKGGAKGEVKLLEEKTILVKPLLF